MLFIWCLTVYILFRSNNWKFILQVSLLLIFNWSVSSKLAIFLRTMLLPLKIILSSVSEDIYTDILYIDSYMEHIWWRGVSRSEKFTSCILPPFYNLKQNTISTADPMMFNISLYTGFYVSTYSFLVHQNFLKTV